MNIGGLFGALTPVFFVLALGYFAGKRNAFDADQSAGLSKLALTFALPASLFVSMTDIRKDLLLQQSRLVLALILSHAGLFVVAWLLLRLVKSLSGTASIIYALMLATSATPVFPCRSRTTFRPNQRRGCGTRGPGNQSYGAPGSRPTWKWMQRRSISMWLRVLRSRAPS